jgi:hypothetical protein
VCKESNSLAERVARLEVDRLESIEEMVTLEERLESSRIEPRSASREGTATCFIATENGNDVVAMIGRACAFLLDELDWTPDRLCFEVTTELENVIDTHPKYAAA